jgi:amino acid adenylation domain-containing protein
VQNFAKAQRVTPFSVLLAAYGILLRAYTQQDDILVGTPSAGRNRAELEDLIGFFVNTVVLRLELDKADDFKTLVKKVSQSSLTAFEHQNLPFEQLVELLNPERDLSHSPIYQVLFTQETTPMGGVSAPGVTMTPEAVDNQTVKVDQGLSVLLEDGHISATVKFNPNLFERDTAVRLLKHYHKILQQVMQQPELRLGEVDLLTAEERQQILSEFNQSDIDYNQRNAFHEIFQTWVDQNPDAPAISYKGKVLSYSELDRQANQLAHYLVQQGSSQDQPIGLCLNRCPEMIVSMLATLKAGSSFVPLAPDYPQERLQYMAEDARVGLVITNKATQADCGFFSGKRFVWEDEQPALASLPTTTPTLGIGVDDVAYMIYTSGTTGRPKGVLVPHRGMQNLAANMKRHLDVDQGCRVAQFASFSFDAAIFDFIMALGSGGCLVLGDAEDFLPGPRMVQLLQDEQVSHMTIPPSALAALTFAELPHLRVLSCAGEALPQALVNRWAPGRKMFNLYGPTEATIWASLQQVTADDEKPTIGTPIDNAFIYIMDEQQNLAPVGVPGELCIGGAGITRGYLNREDLTTCKFIENPFADDSARRLYRSGDLARWNNHGQLEFLGRIDHQVKLRGYRIELEEINHHLRQHPAVESGLTIVREDLPGDATLVAYVVVKQTDWEADVRLSMEKQLPDYMVPSFFVALESIPLTPNGKIDVAQLPKPDRDQAGRKAAYVAPGEGMPSQIAEIWKTLLQLEEVGVNDNFFDLGGQSLLVVKVQEQLKAQLDIDVDIMALFKHPTISGLVTYLEKGDQAEALDDSRERAKRQKASMKAKREKMRKRKKTYGA